MSLTGGLPSNRYIKKNKIIKIKTELLILKRKKKRVFVQVRIMSAISSRSCGT